ncbi:MAG: alpha/beta hydrolase [Bryobacteraceae bacterium]|nr:alpha/beta hydrolase [Bryobacteraceae bacterium]
MIGSSIVAMALMAAAQIPNGVRVERNLVYAKASGRDMLLDIYRPAKPQGELPVVVWVYGGAFRAGSKDDRQTAGATWLVDHGYAVVAFNYRLSQVAKFPAQTHDCKAAVRWLRANGKRYGLDTRRIAAWGASAGGHLAAMLGTSAGVAELEGDLGNAGESSAVQAVVDFYGPTDFLQMDAQALPGGMKHDVANSPESELVGGPIQENREAVQRANPITYVSAGDAPFLILHGERDPLVPVGQSVLLFEALRKAGAPATFYKIAGAGHGGPEFQSPMVRAMVLAFLDQQLKGR